MPRLHAASPCPVLLWEGVRCWMGSPWKQETHLATGTPHHAGGVLFPTLFGCTGLEIPILTGTSEIKLQCLQDQAHQSHAVGIPSTRGEEEGEAVPLCVTPSPSRQPTQGRATGMQRAGQMG